MTLPDTTHLLLALCMFLGAALYTSVGHAGASAYIALMALFGLPAATMRPTALVLNIVAASLTSVRFVRAGWFRWRTLWPLVLGSIPAAYLGGTIQLPPQYYRPVLGVVLLAAAIRLLWPKPLANAAGSHDAPVPLGIATGAVIGLLSGLTGTGGGIFLSPILLFLAWSETRTASGVAAVFILCNSIAGLAGNYAAVKELPPDLPVFAGAVLLGALVGSTLGIGRLSSQALLKALGGVLLIAAAKLFGVY